ncbi:hypothetical protein ACODT5_45390 [Streptomyces sp. 5.8]|uniref:hypothetical protein n=1 Tax=Streptomyces sp. 5.8 TaxID=3406571 RepID=UPI003BB5C33B
MARTARQILNTLDRHRSVRIRSSAELVAHVDSAAAVIDRQRRENGQGAVRRKPDLRPVAQAECGRSVELTPWQVLHAVARGYVLAGQGMGRGLAEHWLGLKYCEALHGNRAGAIDLTEKGRTPERWYKAMQARELAVGFGLAAAEHIVQQRYPDHIISVVDTSTILRAGWALGGSQRDKESRPRPDYLIEAWKPGEPSKVTFVVCPDTHVGVRRPVRDPPVSAPPKKAEGRCPAGGSPCLAQIAPPPVLDVDPCRGLAAASTSWRPLQRFSGRP